MNFTKKMFNGILIISTRLKRATMSEASGFKDFLFKEIEDGRDKILIDLRSCEFIDSTFLGTLISASRKLIKDEGSIRILAHYTLVPSILKLTGTSKMLPVFENEEEAVESFGLNN